MSAQERPDYGPLINHLQELRRKGAVPRRRGVAVAKCSACRDLRRTILVDGQYRVVYSQPCLACRGGGASDREYTSA
ncbi:hypothetical protein [Streptomyces sp. A0592]|uniref:hypothetical protein n=1 Tax=Streptomyces sp. A0592 TaxID=2563099 RepID=UPI00109E9390|nr:hypothetical protein [Streptomyces sp. A0592]THA82709.1 hypothetical protein E6U81_19380 [Streptomyces sp. A0592]